MKKIVMAFLLIVVLGLAAQANTASANNSGADQLPRVFKTFSYTIQD
ncbi:hypothetical protein M3193_07545 [Sporosarcina luteola]|nr:hypothetical protein [Sporosarcina luteola]MCM3743996.1 hypothetical protein [Sporosarcina luteola]